MRKTEYMVSTFKRLEIKNTYITLGGETDNSNPSRLIFSIKIPSKQKCKSYMDK